MSTVINNPSSDGEGGATGLIIGIMLVIVIGALFFIYGLPAIRGANAPQQGAIDVNIKLPTGGGNGGAAPAANY